MTLFRRSRLPSPLPAAEDIPPRPAPQPYRESRLGPDTTPKLAFGPGPCDPEFDPCGKQYPPLKTRSDEKGDAA